MLVFSVKDPVFRVQPVFVAGCPPHEVQAYLHCRWKIDQQVDSDAAGTMFTFPFPPWRLVWVRHPVSSADFLPTLVHELLHLVTRICQDKGIPVKSYHTPGEFGDETAAYLLEFFLRECLKRTGRAKRSGKAGRKRG